MTAHVVEMLAKLGRCEEAVDRGVRWLLAAQEDDGSWFGRWGANHVYGTGAVVPALIAAGLATDDPAVAMPSPGWRATRTPTAAGARTCAPTGTTRNAAAGRRPPPRRPGPCWRCSPRASAPRRPERGVAYLVATQREDGSWDEPWFTGTGFPGDFYINYHLYRLVFPVTALGRFVNGETHG